MRILILAIAASMFLFAASCKEKKAEGGYKYTHHVKKGGKTPQVGEIGYFHVYLRNGDKVMNSSRMEGELAKFKLPEVSKDGKNVSPIVAALRLMAVGDSLTIFMPIDTIKQLPPELAGVKELAYDLVLTDIKTEEVFNKELEADRAEMTQKIEAGKQKADMLGAEVKSIIAQYKSNKLANVQTTPGGVKVYFTQQGTGPKAEAGTTASVQYYGCLMNGEKFDDSFSRGMQPFNLEIGAGSVIKGWDEGLTTFNEGSKGYLFIPAALGYGKDGMPPAIPGNADLVFYVEIEKVKK